MDSVNKTYKFPDVYCSNCGQAFGPGDNGFSHCENHAGLFPKQQNKAFEILAAARKVWDAAKEKPE